MNPTDQRLEVIPRLLKDDLSLFEGVLLTGSMVFGKYHSVTDRSDIDLIFIVDRSMVVQLKECSLFGQINVNDDLVHAFSEQLIDRFWLDYLVGDIKVNLGIWESHFLDDFLAIKAESHKLGTVNPVVQEIKAVDPNGNPHPYVPQVKRYESVFIKQFPLLIEGVPISSPSYCNLIASEVLYDPQRMWQPKVQQFIGRLNIQFGSTWFEYFMEYVVRKSSVDYIGDLRKRTIGALG